MTLLLPVASAHSAPTKLLSYQGRITDSNGQPIANGANTLRYRIYTTKTDCDTDSNSNKAWEELHDGVGNNPAQVQVTNGLFSDVLGTDPDTPLSISFDADYWLGVKVGAGAQFNPCDRLTTAPYAIRAVDANSADNAKACNADTTCETQAISASGDVSLGTGVQVDFFDETGDKVYWYSNTYGTGIESSTLTNWAATQFRWRVGGTSVSSGTEEMLLTGSGLNLSQNDFVAVGDGTNRAYTSSGGAYAHFGYNAFFNGTSWVENVDNQVGLMFQADATSATKAFRFYYAPAAVGAPVWSELASIDQTGKITATNFTGSLTGTADNAKACTGDATCEIGYAEVNAQDAGSEGGEVRLLGAGANATWQIDNYAGRVRMHTGGTTYFDIDAGGSLNITGDVRATKGLRTGGTGDVTDGSIAATNWIGAGCEANCESAGGYSIMYANGDIISTAKVQSPIFYDNDNTGYYADPAATSRLERVSSVYLDFPGDNIEFGTNRTDDATYEWAGWYSGATRAGIFLWDGAWSGCADGKFCIFGDAMQLMIKSNTGNVLIDDNVEVPGTLIARSLAAGDLETVIGPGTGADNQYHAVQCSAGYAMTAVNIYSSGTYLDGDITIVCQNLSAFLTGAAALEDATLETCDGCWHYANCAAGKVATGIRIYANAQLDYNMQLYCTSLSSSGNSRMANWYTSGSNDEGDDDIMQGALCPTGSFVSNIAIYAATYLDGDIRIRCTAPKTW